MERWLISLHKSRTSSVQLVAGCIHLAQAVGIVLLANSFSLPVRATYLAGPPGPGAGRLAVTLFSVNFAWAIAAFFGLSALAHFTVPVRAGVLHGPAAQVSHPIAG